MSSRSNKAMKIACLALIGCFGLASCDDIQAKPTDYDDEVVSILGYDEEIYNNVMSVIYDALHDGSVPSDVLDEVLYQYAISAFGRYNEIVSPESDSVTLKTAVKDAVDHQDANGKVSGASVANEFIKGHKAYWTVDNSGDRINDDNGADEVPASEDDDACQSEYARLIAKWNTIEDRIAETMYEAITGGSYSTRDIFYEKEYLMSLYSSFNKVCSPLNVPEDVELAHCLIYPDIEKEDVFKEIEGIDGTPLLHRELYQSNYELDASESASDAFTYVEDTIIPNIYRDLLIEQYILDETYNSLGRSYARKVNVIAIPESSDYKSSTWYLMHYFLDNVINAEPEGDSVVESTNQVDLDTFKTLATAYRGIDLNETDNPEALKYITESEGFEEIETEYGDVTYTGYLGTPYGEVVEKIKKLENNYDISDVVSDFTGGGSYPIPTGIEMSENTVRLTNYVYNGWFIKNGGLSSLPEDIRTRLYNINVANAIQEGNPDGVIEHDRWQKVDGEWTYTTDNDVNNYVAIINGKYYLKASSVVSGHESEDVLFYEDGTYYVVQIEEAVSSSKLSKTSDNRYTITRGADVMEDAVNEITKLVAASSNYDSLSTEYWLEQGELVYHDQAVYDYFYENYPDLFDD